MLMSGPKNAFILHEVFLNPLFLFSAICTEWTRKKSLYF